MMKPSASVIRSAAVTTRDVPTSGATATKRLCTSSTVIPVSAAELQPGPTVDVTSTVANAREVMKREGLDWVAVLDEGRPRGWIAASQLDGHDRIAEIEATRFPVAVNPSDSLRHALDALVSSPTQVVIVVDPDIDVQNSEQVEWAVSFRSQPARDVIVVNGLGAGPLDPSIDESIPLDQRTGSALGIDATYPYGTVIKIAGDACGPSVAEHGKEFVEVADVPGWRQYDFPELDNHGR